MSSHNGCEQQMLRVRVRRLRNTFTAFTVTACIAALRAAIPNATSNGCPDSLFI